MMATTGERPPTVPELYIHSGCHPSTPTWAVYRPAKRELEIICGQCSAHIVTFTLAERAL